MAMCCIHCEFPMVVIGGHVVVEIVWKPSALLPNGGMGGTGGADINSVGMLTSMRCHNGIGFVVPLPRTTGGALIVAWDCTSKNPVETALAAGAGDGRRSNKRSGATPPEPCFATGSLSTCPTPRSGATCIGLGALALVCAPITGIMCGICGTGDRSTTAGWSRFPSGAKLCGTDMGDAAVRAVLAGVP